MPRLPGNLVTPPMRDARKFFHHRRPFAMKRGGQLPEFTLAWESWGSLNGAKDNAVLVLTGLSPDAHATSSQDNPAEGWWEYMIGPGRPIDTDRWYVICINSLGSCKGSTGPASNPPGSDEHWGPDFPELTLEDVAASAHLLVSSLGIEQLAVLVGPSMGGMSALAYALQEPGSARHLVSISSATSASAFAIAVRSLQREIIRADRHWNGGRYHDDEWPEAGIRLARKLGVISYRSAPEWDQRFARERMSEERRSGKPFAPEFEIESYLEAHADRFVGGFDPNCYLYLSRAMDWFDAGEYGESVDDALSRTGLESALVLGVESDILFPLHQQEELRDSLMRGGVTVEYHSLPSIQGHDAFLVDRERFGPAVRTYLERL